MSEDSFKINKTLSSDKLDEEVEFTVQKSPSTDICYEVTFSMDGDPDPEDIARRLSIVRKYYISILITITSMVITIISSCWSLISPQIMEHFHISHEVSVLGISFYIFGLGVGPLILSPLSELYGRRLTFIFSLALSIIWQCLTTWSKTIEGVMFGRFLSGFFGSSFLSVAGGSISDIFEKKDIGIPMAIFTTSPMLGPSIGPIIGGALHKDSYKWTFIVLLIASGVCLVLITLTVPETYKPMLLIRKAKRLRQETGDDKYYAPLEITRKETKLTSAIILSARRPFGLLVRDPMMAVLTFYTGLVLAIVYLFFVAFPYIFETVFKFTVMEVACAYIGMLSGILLVSPTALIIQKRYAKKVENNNGVSTPEMRFEALFYGAFLTPIGLMIFAWTCYPQVHWIGPVIGSGIFGSGVFFVFTGVFSYTVDAYRKYAASAMACNSFVRSTMSAVFPLFGLQMYKGMGINWAGFFIAMLATIMVPVPFLFTKYGPTLRSKSPYAWAD
ncbi:hypothetical protein Kpol_1051p15 [Vanderwaltozyma polyspora DSM 70294]|uniref:Major facilitator superfamily (MFS) profile domain-containing protein n=1 Tax=Vanderwaltozyma polyspora (strain ATCC 22028 / DSM 70294 / BCRC 21397 / CBS 2163 / NBRC 10782 / NRRL Y-8283 / UCD 57-17) TaxID=436907 RepID=A7TMX8_VANPO|nr:uncharacterized protein Kpol_1051p15 [Vanderwaltozyma polyspora DSM 70294]EDO16366.1 hypothetical protein Kpol_1051p15 [Vanderwaltozyma polyspora DSM 70294]